MFKILLLHCLLNICIVEVDRFLNNGKVAYLLAHKNIPVCTNPCIMTPLFKRKEEEVHNLLYFVKKKTEIEILFSAAIINYLFWYLVGVTYFVCLTIIPL